MKVTFQTQDLCRALERVQRAAQTKVTSNTNNGFFISAEDGKVEFQANDYSIGIRTFCEADVEERGSVLISAPHLLSTIKMMPSGPVVMEQKKAKVLFSLRRVSIIPIFPQEIRQNFRWLRKLTIRSM